MLEIEGTRANMVAQKCASSVVAAHAHKAVIALEVE